jgi:CheY-like chemotaxis protein
MLKASPTMSSEARPHPLSVFLTEDEALIQMMVAEMIEELGHTVIAEASSLDQALRLAKTATFDVAISCPKRAQPV